MRLVGKFARSAVLLMIRTSLPSTIKVGAHDYTVAEKDQAWKDAVGAYGLCQYEAQVISVVTAKVSCTFVFDTLLHEILHAIWRERDLDDDDEEEKVVTVLAAGLTAMFRDNPALMKYQNAVLREYHKNNK